MRRWILPAVFALTLLSSSCVLFTRRPGNCPACPAPQVIEKKCPEAPAAVPCKAVPCKPVPCAPVKVEEPAREEPKRAEPAPTTAECNPGHALLNATLWVQTAAEYRAASIQTFAAARGSLDKGLADHSWIGAAEENENGPNQPPAVIVDIDESVIDNTRFEARVIQQGKTYDSEQWDQWTAESDAAAVPGAAEFLSYARDKGVKVFYISNRTIDEESETLANLRRLGYPVDDSPDTLLMRAERTAWQSGDKSLRREFAASSHRILLMVGDDLNDFMNARDANVTERDEMVARTRSWWGTRWFMIANPMYGSWERALTGGTGSPCDQVRKKVESLRD